HGVKAGPALSAFRGAGNLFPGDSNSRRIKNLLNCMRNFRADAVSRDKGYGVRHRGWSLYGKEVEEAKDVEEAKEAEETQEKNAPPHRSLLWNAMTPLEESR